MLCSGLSGEVEPFVIDVPDGYEQLEKQYGLRVITVDTGDGPMLKGFNCLDRQGRSVFLRRVSQDVLGEHAFNERISSIVSQISTDDRLMVRKIITLTDVESQEHVVGPGHCGQIKHTLDGFFSIRWDRTPRWDDFIWKATPKEIEGFLLSESIQLIKL